MGSTSFLGFSCPNLLLVFLNLLFLGTCIIFFFASVGTFSGSFLLYISVPYFGLGCDHVNSFLCLVRVRKRRYWKEVRTVFNEKTTVFSGVPALRLL